MQVSREPISHAGQRVMRSRRPTLRRIRRTAALLMLCLASLAQAAQVQYLNTQPATASAAGTPTIASFNISSGKNRVLFFGPTFERDRCPDADVAAGLCVNGNVAGAGLGDNCNLAAIHTNDHDKSSALPRCNVADGLRIAMLQSVFVRRIEVFVMRGLRYQPSM